MYVISRFYSKVRLFEAGLKRIRSYLQVGAAREQPSNAEKLRVFRGAVRALD